MRRKAESRLDSFEENFRTLTNSGGKGIKVLYRSLSTVRSDLSDLSNLTPSKISTSLEKIIQGLDDLDKKILTLEDSLEEGLNKTSQEYQKFKKESEDKEDERRIYRLLYELSTVIYAERDINLLLETVLDSVIEIFSVDKGFLEIYDENKNLKLRLAKDKQKKVPEESEEKIKSDLIDLVLSTGNNVLIQQFIYKEIEEKEDWGKGTKSLLCVPLKSRENVLGVIYLEDSGEGEPFVSGDIELLSSLAERTSVALENNLLFMELKESEEKLLADLRGKFKFDEILGNSPQMVEVLKIVADIADTEATVLIEGESGTGKELLARAIHFNSSRSRNSFVPINCAAIPETLLESELFGYEKGAFTGATQRKLGKFEVANGGTIFLDEIGEMSPLLQVKILRFLQSHEFEPLGSNKVKRSDVRIISATNKDLFTLVKENRFREDLYYRINVINLKLPTLRERKLDIAPLAESFAQKFTKKSDKEIKGIEPETLNILSRYRFPGNIRELENIIERAVILAKGEWITKDDLPKNIFNGSGMDAGIKIAQNYPELKSLRKKVVEEVEKKFLEDLLQRNQNNVSQAAKDAGMHRVELQRLLKKYK
ncbi:MAG: sigma 54-interacting transcriptional regulator [candidate division Zixibacteria bacterium]|nr:sigma 54-interacting transcriptional regulator [candidate division Zixibacteria bacterium]